jgi:hypothetical protein
LGRIGVPATPGVPGADVAWWCGLAAATMPLLALHQGTFVGVARPAEPFIAVYASLAAGALWPRLGRMTVPVAVGAAAAIAVWHDARSLADRSVVPPEVVVARLAGADPSGDVLAPPYYAALAGRRMLFDYADWTVLGMRAAAGVPREQVLTRRLVGVLDAGDVPLVAADFRLTYIPGVAEALAGSYVEAGDDGDQLARRIVFYAPAA